MTDASMIAQRTPMRMFIGLVPTTGLGIVTDGPWPLMFTVGVALCARFAFMRELPATLGGFARGVSVLGATAVLLYLGGTLTPWRALPELALAIAAWGFACVWDGSYDTEEAPSRRAPRPARIQALVVLAPWVALSTPGPALAAALALALPYLALAGPASDRAVSWAGHVLLAGLALWTLDGATAARGLLASAVWSRASRPELWPAPWGPGPTT